MAFTQEWRMGLVSIGGGFAATTSTVNVAEAVPPSPVTFSAYPVLALTGAHLTVDEPAGIGPGPHGRALLSLDEEMTPVAAAGPNSTTNTGPAPAFTGVADVKVLTLGATGVSGGNGGISGGEDTWTANDAMVVRDPFRTVSTYVVSDSIGEHGAFHEPAPIGPSPQGRAAASVASEITPVAAAGPKFTVRRGLAPAFSGVAAANAVMSGGSTL
jgi:hypothetical protein